jgi:hypothetical protein
VGNVVEVAVEHHNTTEELRDVMAVPDGGWRRLSTVVRSAVHDTEMNQSGGSHSQSMVAG